MWRAMVMALLLALGCAGNAQAQTKKELVAKVLQLQQGGIENVGRVIIGQTAQRALQSAGQMIPQLAADKREAAAKDIQADVKKFYDEMEPVLKKRAAELAPAALGPVYEERFSEDELKQILASLSLQVAKKFQQVDGESANVLAQKLVADTRGMIEPRIKVLEASLAKRLGMTAVSGSASAASAARK
jgi:uncharacterized protein